MGIDLKITLHERSDDTVPVGPYLPDHAWMAEKTSEIKIRRRITLPSARGRRKTRPHFGQLSALSEIISLQSGHDFICLMTKPKELSKGNPLPERVRRVASNSRFLGALGQYGIRWQPPGILRKERM
jgi:hypothetical protein